MNEVETLGIVRMSRNYKFGKLDIIQLATLTIFGNYKRAKIYESKHRAER